jgi:hypothetical protein
MSFRQISSNLWASIKKDILGLLKRKYEFYPYVFINPVNIHGLCLLRKLLLIQRFQGKEMKRHPFKSPHKRTH